MDGFDNDWNDFDSENNSQPSGRSAFDDVWQKESNAEYGISGIGQSSAFSNHSMQNAGGVGSEGFSNPWGSPQSGQNANDMQFMQSQVQNNIYNPQMTMADVSMQNGQMGMQYSQGTMGGQMPMQGSSFDMQNGQMGMQSDQYMNQQQTGFNQDQMNPQQIQQPQGQMGYWEQQSMQEDAENGVNQQETNQPKQVKLSSKMIAAVLAGVFLLLLIVIVAGGNIKDSNAARKAAKEQAKAQQAQQAAGVSRSSGMTKLDDGVKIDYSGSVLEAVGTVTAKNKYLQGNQVLYEIKIQIGIGTATQEVSYFCTYTTWNSVLDNDVLVVRYQQVSDNCFSVNEVTR